jgi:hypothetical protein
MDVTLGPFKNAMAANVSELDPLANAMHDQAEATAKALGFSPVDAKNGKPGAKGYTISAKITSVTTDDTKSTHVIIAFTVWVDGTFSNASLPPSRGSGQGASAADIVQSITEGAVTKILKAIQSGQIRKAS